MTENELRESVINVARNYIGTKEGSEKHKEIIDVYNAYNDPNRRTYKMTTKVSWCMTFVSFCFIKSGLAGLIVTECSCQQAIIRNNTIKKNWVESDAYVPKPADIIMYDWQDSGSGDNTGWPDHTGIVESCNGKNITIIEGNYSDTVKRRILEVNGKYIRGFITPDYKSKVTTNQPPEMDSAEDDYDYQTTGQLRIRKTPIEGATVVAMPAGAKIKSLCNPWVKVRYKKENKTYEGWASIKYLKKI